MTKRKQVKNACVNCQKACKKCDDMRPCSRCVKYGIEHLCVNSGRKDRKRGVRRGPYRTNSASATGSNQYDDENPSSKSVTADEEYNATGEAGSSAYPSWIYSYDRPKRAAVRTVNYRERDLNEPFSFPAPNRSEAPLSSSEVDYKPFARRGPGRPPSSLQTSPSPVVTAERYSAGIEKNRDPHQVLFKVVLGCMHGDLVIPREQPKICDLARVCAEIIDGRTVSSADLHLVDADRQAHNYTPLSAGSQQHLERVIPTPPDTPTSGKSTFYADANPQSYGLYAPVPMAAYHFPLPPNFL